MDGKVGLFKQYHIHYEDIAVNVFKELEKLMAIVREDGVLEQAKCPAIIIQAQNDAVADPDSAQKIYDSIFSKIKELYRPETGGHSIVPEEERHEAFRHAAMFLEALK